MTNLPVKFCIMLWFWTINVPIFFSFTAFDLEFLSVNKSFIFSHGG